MLPRKLGPKIYLDIYPLGLSAQTQDHPRIDFGLSRKEYHIYLEVHVLVVKYYFNCLQHTKSTQGDPAPSKLLSYAIKLLIIKQ